MLQPLPVAATAGAVEVTDRVQLQFVQQVSAEENRVLLLTVGLFGREAPESVEVFKRLATGKLIVGCSEPPEAEANSVQRATLSTKSVYKQCVGSESVPVTYSGSLVWRIVQGKRVDAGQVKGIFALRQAPQTSLSESPRLKHDAAGLLSVRRGGGTFDFGLTTGPDNEADADYVVIGRVLEGMAVLEEMDALPVVRAAEVFSQGEGASASRAKACAYGSANQYCSQLKPLKKLVLSRIAVL